MNDVRLETADGVAVLTLDRAPVNALSSAFYDEISTALDRVALDDSAHVLVLQSSSSRAFCAGADITELAGLTGPEAEQADVQRQESSVAYSSCPSRALPWSTARRSARERSSRRAATCGWGRPGPVLSCPR
ncbi:enoyl-CoA hydratase/isomerase family protein [Streptomyces sp. NPDC056716]|uniref:enoyl-CoA hydratase/isomerase family protein n=1 Tax=Streptomyces sp. NPDC056716 TaxID=3345922 RepID=UPI0036954C97